MRLRRLPEGASALRAPSSAESCADGPPPRAQRRRQTSIAQHVLLPAAGRGQVPVRVTQLTVLRRLLPSPSSEVCRSHLHRARNSGCSWLCLNKVRWRERLVSRHPCQPQPLCGLACLGKEEPPSAARSSEHPI